MRRAPRPATMQRQHRMANLHCRIRKHRKTLRLSQRELALLVGLKSQGAVSEIEAGRKRPGLGVALACALLFDAALPELFPGLFEHATRALLSRLQDAQDNAGNAGASTGAALARLDSSHSRS